MNHESWAKKYEKIKGVFNDITELCACLKRDKEKFEQDQICRKLIDLLSKQSLSSNEFDEFFNIKNPKYNISINRKIILNSLHQQIFHLVKKKVVHR